MYLDITKTGKYRRALLRVSYRVNGKVQKDTLANVSNCNTEDLEAIKFGIQYYKKYKAGTLTDLNYEDIKHGKSAGAVFVLSELANRIGLTRALGSDHNAKLALWQIISRILDQGSRLSAVRLHERHLLTEAIGIKSSFCEDDLYKNLRWIEGAQDKIENELFKTRYKDTPCELLLYDVTSSYLEGQHNELAQYGYNRDRKKGKKQIVIGLLCDVDGFPISVQVFSGNISDTTTFYDQIEKTVNRFGLNQVTFVGDRGMIKSTQKEELTKANFNFITALTKAQITTLEKEETIQVRLFDEDICKVEKDNIRYILRKNPVRADEIEASRLSKEEHIESYTERLNEYLDTHKKASIDIALRKVKERIGKLKCSWLSVDKEDRKIKITRDAEKLNEISRLDGCYVITTDVPKERLSEEAVHKIYKNLAKVERAFRESKTGHLELRPIYVRKEASTRGHVFVVMCAYLLRKELEKAWSQIDCTVEEGLASLSTISSVIIKGTNNVSVESIPQPTGRNADLLDALNYKLPTMVIRNKVKVDTRKKLVDSRK